MNNYPFKMEGFYFLLMVQNNCNIRKPLSLQASHPAINSWHCFGTYDLNKIYVSSYFNHRHPYRLRPFFQIY
ncbi:MAG: hypothetical protein EAZ13_05665 [Sphingobacteriia bacterium]|nr:MAG: hypothetical protein EAZ13_05665 [Sphingobacteriia bacterium]